MTEMFLSTCVRRDPFHFFGLFGLSFEQQLLLGSLAGAVGAVGNDGGFLSSFSKCCGKARHHRGFPQHGRFHSPVPRFSFR